MFAAMSRLSQSARSCQTTATPRRSTAAGSAGTGRPAKSISPPAGAMSPEMQRTSVVLPAPFSPASATSSPGRRHRSTWSSARSGPNRAASPWTDSSGHDPGCTGGATPAVMATLWRFSWPSGQGRPARTADRGRPGRAVKLARNGCPPPAGRDRPGPPRAPRAGARRADGRHGAVGHGQQHRVHRHPPSGARPRRVLAVQLGVLELSADPDGDHPRLRQAGRPVGAQADPDHRDPDLPGRVRPVRVGLEHGQPDLLPRAAGPGRRIDHGHRQHARRRPVRPGGAGPRPGLAVERVGGSAVFGPTVGGSLAQYVSWRWIFVINLPLGAAAVALIARFLHERVIRTRHRIDVAGAVLVLLAAGALIFGLLQGGVAWAWRSPPSIAVFAVAAAATVAATVVESRAAEPIVPQPVVSTFVLGFGLGLISVCTLVGPQSTVTWERRGVVTRTVMFCRFLGQSVGAAIFGAIFNAALAARLYAAPPALAGRLPQRVDQVGA